MSIDQLDLILYDMYRMDAWLPPLFGKWTEDYALYPTRDQICDD